MGAYKILFCLENDEFVVLEIKRLGLPDDADKSMVYSWLLFDKKNQHLEPLIFQSMKSELGEESRRFEQAELRFDNRRGIVFFKEKESLLIVNDLDQYLVSQELSDAVDEYLGR